jgi:toxin ParE1/3/4
VRLRYTRQALADLEVARSYIAERNPQAAAAMAVRVREAIAGLSLFSERGRKGRVEGTRELVIPGTPFLVAYRVRPDQIEILAILHGARRWPEAF